jgi:dTDP-4-dehydrorhamnose reductase
MKLLLTGLNGTLAPVLARSARARGMDVIGWDRAKVPTEDTPSALRWLAEENPDAIAHLAVGSVDWAGLLARYSSERSLPMLFTSTAMVFDNHPDGPHQSGDERNAKDDYGRTKIESEDAILAACSHACIARIGWQIDPHRSGNNMIAALDRQQVQDGRIRASELWRPAEALADLLLKPVPGVTHIDSNADEGHDFASIVAALRQNFQRHAWIIETTRDYLHDQRLVGGGALVPPLSERLLLLKRAT